MMPSSASARDSREKKFPPFGQRAVGTSTNRTPDHSATASPPSGSPNDLQKETEKTKMEKVLTISAIAFWVVIVAADVRRLTFHKREGPFPSSFSSLPSVN